MNAATGEESNSMKNIGTLYWSDTQIGTITQQVDFARVRVLAFHSTDKETMTLIINFIFLLLGIAITLSFSIGSIVGIIMAGIGGFNVRDILGKRSNPKYFVTIFHSDETDPPITTFVGSNKPAVEELFGVLKNMGDFVIQWTDPLSEKLSP